MSKIIKIAVMVGRFQPFHKGHEEVIKLALNQANHVILVCGSSFLPRTPRNPWTYSEIESMVRSCFPAQQNQITLVPIIDTPYNEEAWIWLIQKNVWQVLQEKFTQENAELYLIKLPFDKDYTKSFPAWDPLELFLSKKISASEIRDDYFQAGGDSDRSAGMVPAPVATFMHKFSSSPEFGALLEEKTFLEKYKKGWESAAYPPTFVTVDAVVCQAGHILMIKRKAYPGKNLLALPGGFIKQDESLLDACLRELRTETRLKMPEPVLKGSLKSKNVYDYPYRSLRGRTITHGFYFELSNDHELPQVKGGEDAKQAFWLPLSQLDSRQIFEDHFSIIQDLLRIYMN
ncbi:MAG: bifunctional nicotinamide-nucleotide adenylyltransferase/Nudix hydroxylase [Alphaproteobacteria bacterium]|nr:bifunctional nicotinamide-nucleotide adenylyltransferase/Nudix hydroxylase [Alphaproteobacteria bacterium]